VTPTDFGRFDVELQCVGGAVDAVLDAYVAAPKMAWM
jgi:hypothetical protein